MPWSLSDLFTDQAPLASVLSLPTVTSPYSPTNFSETLRPLRHFDFFDFTVPLPPLAVGEPNLTFVLMGLPASAGPAARTSAPAASAAIMVLSLLLFTPGSLASGDEPAPLPVS